MSTAGPLPASFEGDVLVPDSPEYDSARAVWNGAVDRRPQYVVRCAGTDDVRAAVRVARELGLPIGVRGGGHVGCNQQAYDLQQDTVRLGRFELPTPALGERCSIP